MPLTPGTVVQFLKNYEVFLYFDMASLTLLVYDYALTFSREVDFVWKKSFSPTTLLFIVIRYLPFVDNTALFLHEFIPNPSLSLCGKSYRLHIWSFVLGIGVADIVLVLRTVAIWRGNRRVAISLSILLMFTIAVAAYFVNDFLRKLFAFPNFITKFPTCALTNTSNHLYICYAVILGFEAVVLLLTLLRANNYQSGTLFKRLYIDSITFFIYLCILSVINITVLLTAPAEVGAILTGVHRNIHSILSGRIILNIRSIGTSTARSGDHAPSETRTQGSRETPSLLTGLTDINGESVMLGTLTLPRTLRFGDRSI